MDFKLITSISDLPKFNKDLPIFSDIETDDLYGPLRMIQLYQPETDDNVYVYDLAPIGYNKSLYDDDYQTLKDYLMDLHTVWFNGSYDLGTMNISPNKTDDLFYAIKSAYPEFMEFGLKKIVTRLKYTQDLYKGIDVKESVKGFVRGAYISNQAYRYAALDVYALSLIWKDPKVQDIIQNNMSYKVDMISQRYALIYQQNGLLLHRGMWEKELIKAKADVVTYTKLLPSGFNPNSYTQVRAYLGVDKSDAEALIAYALSDSEKAQDATYIIKLKRARKQVSYLTSIEFDRMYTKFNVAGAVTGRFTASGGSLVNGFNAQQIPREYQYLFNQATEDTTVIDADYSTLELRLATAIYNEPAMYKQLKEGRDLHTEMAIATTGKKLHPDGVQDDVGDREDIQISEYVVKSDRNKAKGINFGYVFGMSAKTFVSYAYTSYGQKYTLAESTLLRKKYFTQYPNIEKYHTYIWDNYKRPGFVVETALGRRVKPSLGTDGINTPVQGSGAETTKLAVHYLIKDNPTVPMLQYIYNVVHDAIYLRVPRGLEDEYGILLEKAMLKAWVEISKTPLFHFKDIPMIAEVKYIK